MSVPVAPSVARVRVDSTHSPPPRRPTPECRRDHPHPSSLRGRRPAYRQCPTAQVSSDTTITIRASGSTLEFQPPRISAKNGTRVRLRFVNSGTLPHNVVLPRDEGDIDALALAAYGAAESGYVPMDQKDRLLAYSALASPGDTVELTFVVPPPGEYTYICLFPGHANSMFGTLRSLR